MMAQSEETMKKLESYINDYVNLNGITPTFREIEAGTGISKATISRCLSYMRDNGRIEYGGHRNIITTEAKKTSREMIKVPVLGAVSCGLPKYAEENIEEYVRLPISLFGRGQFFLLRANGDSMIEAGICDGDLVLIRQQDYANPGQIVVALTEDEATLKRYYPEPENHRICLHPENKRMRDIYVDSCIIQGVAVKVIKDLE